jgi:predicted GTPase
VAVVNKVDSARPEDVAAVEESVRRLNPGAELVRVASRIRVETPERVAGKRVLVVEDGPTLTHGGMAYGAATLAARAAGAAELADPRPYATGSIAEIFRRYPRLERLLPAVGYSRTQLEELRQTIDAVPCDLVLIGTPVDLKALLGFKAPALRVSYAVEELEGAPLKRAVLRFVDRLPRRSEERP